MKKRVPKNMKGGGGKMTGGERPCMSRGRGRARISQRDEKNFGKRRLRKEKRAAKKEEGPPKLCELRAKPNQNGGMRRKNRGALSLREIKLK